MASLAVANLMHRKLRSGLSVAAVAIGVAMLIVMLGLSHGTLDEVAERVQSVDAELIVLPQHENVIFTGGAAFGAKYRPLIERTELDGRPVVKAVIPVLFDTIRLGGQQQRLFAINGRDMPAFLGTRKIERGRIFDDGERFAMKLDAMRNADGYYDPSKVDEADLNDACELVIDSRLAAVGGYKLGHEETILGRRFRVVGVVESGVAGRVFCPIQVLQHIKNAGMPWASMFFVQLRPPPAANAKDYADRCAAALAERTKARVEQKSNYGTMLAESFSQIYMFMTIASALSMTVCFLFILLTVYMNVLERTREFGILRSLGATHGYVLREVVTEALLLCLAGAAAGILLAYAGKYAIEGARPLLTVKITPDYLLLAIGIAVVGGVVSAVYPAWRATRFDPVVALSFD
jgi:putative ABC transport system permease protein